MLTEYIEKKLNRARYKILKDRSYFGEIPGLRGVWASAETLERCRKELREVLEEWMALKLASREPIQGLEIRIQKRIVGIVR